MADYQISEEELFKSAKVLREIITELPIVIKRMRSAGSLPKRAWRGAEAKAKGIGQAGINVAKAVKTAVSNEWHDEETHLISELKDAANTAAEQLSSSPKDIAKAYLKRLKAAAKDYLYTASQYFKERLQSAFSPKVKEVKASVEAVQALNKKIEQLHPNLQDEQQAAKKVTNPQHNRREELRNNYQKQMTSNKQSSKKDTTKGQPILSEYAQKTQGEKLKIILDTSKKFKQTGEKKKGPTPPKRK